MNRHFPKCLESWLAKWLGYLLQIQQYRERNRKNDSGTNSTIYIRTYQLRNSSSTDLLIIGSLWIYQMSNWRNTFTRSLSSRNHYVHPIHNTYILLMNSSLIRLTSLLILPRISFNGSRPSWQIIDILYRSVLSHIIIRIQSQKLLKICR